MAVLEARNLAKAYARKPVVKDVSLTVKQGEIVGLLGPNGAGKTTTLSMISGLLKPDKGNIRVGDIDVWQSPKKAKPVRHGALYVGRRSDGAWLLETRPETGLLGGMLAWPSTDWVDVSDAEPVDAPPMTADWVDLPYAFLQKMSNEIINKVKGINRVVYDISSKPPATIEWE